MQIKRSNILYWFPVSGAQYFAWLIKTNRNQVISVKMSFEKAFINQFLRIILSPCYWEFSLMKLGKKLFSHWDQGRQSAQKTQSENRCKRFNSVLRTPTKFVLFSNQKVRKYFHLQNCQARTSITKVGQKRSYTTSYTTSSKKMDDVLELRLENNRAIHRQRIFSDRMTSLITHIDKCLLK